MDWIAIGLSVRLAAATTLVLLALGIPFAYWLATTRFRFRALIEALVALPLVLPPTVLGFYLLLALGPRSPLGRALGALVGHPLPFSFAGLLVGSVIYSLPFAVQPFVAAFARVDHALLEAAWCLGVSRTRAVLRVALPLARPGIIAGAVLAFMHTLGEFGVVLMLGGNLPGSTRTVSVAVYDDVQALAYASAQRTALLLLVASFAALAVTHTLLRREPRA